MFIYLLKMSCNGKLFQKNVTVLPELLLKPDWINKKSIKEGSCGNTIQNNNSIN